MMKQKRDRQVTLNIFKKYKPTHVIHLAAYVGSVYAHSHNSLDFFVIFNFIIYFLKNIKYPL
jgi:hypothetical protein